MSQAVAAELLQLNQRLLDSIGSADWTTYESLCDPTLSAFEPEGAGQFIEGLAFHRFYFEMRAAGASKAKHQTTIANPKVRLLGDTALVTYIRLTQRVLADGSLGTTSHEETRVWHRSEGQWRMVHFHRSAPSQG
jgi:calcium/calmodulin-dependent protein kinase (CaM kinase) II